MITQILESWSKITSTLQHRLRFVGYGLTAFAFIYLATLIIISREQIQQIHWQVYWLPILISLPVYLGSILVQYLVWSRMISFHHRIGWRDMAIYIRVLLLKRLPGGVWHWVDRTAVYTDVTQVPGRVIMLANILEWALLLLLAGGIALAGWPTLTPWLRAAVAAIPLLASFYLAYAWQSKNTRKLVRLFEAGLWLGLYILAWGAGGFLLYLFAQATRVGLPGISDYPNLSLFTSIWAWSIAGGSSLLIVFIPAGLGVREITLTWLLSPYMPVSAILLISIVIRLTYLLADVLWGSMGMTYSMRLYNVKPAPTPIPNDVDRGS